MNDNNKADGVVKNCFSRPVNVEKVKSQGLREAITANAQECQELATQLAINRLDALSFNCLVMPWKKGGVEISGQVTAKITETCVVTLELFSTEISQDVKRYFERAARPGAEIPVLDIETIQDDLPDSFDGGKIDIGDIAIETLALCLSPHPRKPGAVFTDHLESDPHSGDNQAGENPFDVLQQLKNTDDEQ